MVGHSLDMERPVEMGHKEDTQVTNGLGDGDPVG